jgi:replication-associated recombination protein RarA
MSIATLSQPTPLLSELMRPQVLSDLTLPRRKIGRLREMFDSGLIMNMLLHGGPGTGKTSAAHILKKAVGPHSFMEVNGTSPKVKDDVQRFASTACFDDGLKLCLIDEAEFMSNSTQASLRNVIEKYSSNCRFLLAANNVAGLDLAVKSRLLPIRFDTFGADRDEVKTRLIKRYEDTLPEFGIAFDEQRLWEIICYSYPDLRAIANEVEGEFGSPRPHRPMRGPNGTVAL